MAQLNNNWWNAFRGSFQTEEDVIEFIFDNINTKGWEDSYKDLGGYGEPNEMIKITAEEKKEVLYNFMMSLIDKK